MVDPMDFSYERESVTRIAFHSKSTYPPPPKRAPDRKKALLKGLLTIGFPYALSNPLFLKQVR